MTKMSRLEGKTGFNSKERGTFTALGKQIKDWKRKNASVSLTMPGTPPNTTSITNFTTTSNKK